MTDDGFDERLHRMLADRAGTLDATLSGPQLRALAEQERHRHHRGRIAAALGAAAAVAAIAVTATLLGGSDGRTNGPVPPGGNTSPAVTRSVSTTPTTGPSPAPTTTPPSSRPAVPSSSPPPKPSAPRPSRSSGPTSAGPRVGTPPARPTGSAARSTIGSRSPTSSRR